MTRICPDAVVEFHIEAKCMSNIRSCCRRRRVPSLRFSHAKSCEYTLSPPASSYSPYENMKLVDHLQRFARAHCKFPPGLRDPPPQGSNQQGLEMARNSQRSAADRITSKVSRKMTAKVSLLAASNGRRLARQVESFCSKHIQHKRL